MVLATYYLTRVEKDGVWCEKIKKRKGFGRYEQFGTIASNMYHKRNRSEPLDFLHILWRARKYLEALNLGDTVYSFLAFDDFSCDHKIKADYMISPHELGERRQLSKRGCLVLSCA